MEAGGGWVQRRLLRRTAVVGDGRTDSGRGHHGDRERRKPWTKTSGFRLGGKYERVRKERGGMCVRAAAQAGVTCMSFSSAIASRKVVYTILGFQSSFASQVRGQYVVGWRSRR